MAMPVFSKRIRYLSARRFQVRFRLSGTAVSGPDGQGALFRPGLLPARQDAPAEIPLKSFRRDDGQIEGLRPVPFQGQLNNEQELLFAVEGQKRQTIPSLEIVKTVSETPLEGGIHPDNLLGIVKHQDKGLCRIGDLLQNIQHGAVQDHPLIPLV